MDSEDGQTFIKVSNISQSNFYVDICCADHVGHTDASQNLAQFVRTHEKALANALQLRRHGPKNGQTNPQVGENATTHGSSSQSSTPPSSTSGAFAAALSLGSLNFVSQSIKPAKLTLTPHHLFFLLSRFEEVGIPIGPMNVRLENIHAERSPANYVSFLSQSQRSEARSDRDSVHSVSSVRSVMLGMSALWSNLGMGSSNNAAKSEKAKAQVIADLKYLYSAFTKIPCLLLSPDRKARLIQDYEEFPFDTAVPLLAFKNLSALEVCDVDFRQFFGWDRLADQLRSLVLKRAHIEDPTDLLLGIVLDDMDKRRRRSGKSQSSPVTAWPTSPSMRYSDLAGTHSAPGSPLADDKLARSAGSHNSLSLQGYSERSRSRNRPRPKSTSPSRPMSSRQESSYRHMRGSTNKIKRSGSGSSNSSDQSSGPYRAGSSSNLSSMGILPASKWRFLRHLSLADNSLAHIVVASFAPLANTLHSLDLSSNLFTEIPDSLATLSALRALNLSNCMIESLHSLTRNPLPAITALNLRANRLASIAGVERLLSLERLDLRGNKILDPTEVARLTGTPNIREIWVLSNPFVKIHSNYRLTIFNLFRTTPGFLEDIVIDGVAPGYSERRQLRDRVAETESMPVVKPVLVEHEASLPSVRDSSIMVASGEYRGHAAEVIQRPTPWTLHSDVAVTSSRRKKVSRRRIVDLATDDGFHRRASSEASLNVQASSKGNTMGTRSNEQMPETNAGDLQPLINPANSSCLQISGAASPVRPPRNSGFADNDRSNADEIQNLNLNGEAYRLKVESLKHEVGSNWLSVLSEDGWIPHGRSESLGPGSLGPGSLGPGFNHVNAIRPELSNLRASSQGITSGSRTLG